MIPSLSCASFWCKRCRGHKGKKKHVVRYFYRHADFHANPILCHVSGIDMWVTWQLAHGFMHIFCIHHMCSEAENTETSFCFTFYMSHTCHEADNHIAVLPSWCAVRTTDSNMWLTMANVHATLVTLNNVISPIKSGAGFPITDLNLPNVTGSHAVWLNGRLIVRHLSQEVIKWLEYHHRHPTAICEAILHKLRSAPEHVVQCLVDFFFPLSWAPFWLPNANSVLAFLPPQKDMLCDRNAVFWHHSATQWPILVHSGIHSDILYAGCYPRRPPQTYLN